MSLTEIVRKILTTRKTHEVAVDGKYYLKFNRKTQVNSVL